MKDSEYAFYTKYFENNGNNTKNTWKGIKAKFSIIIITNTMFNSTEVSNKIIMDPKANEECF